MTVEEVNNIPFFFIVGRGRSGTTLLQNVLDANDSVLLPLESFLIISLKNKFFNTKKWTEKKIDAFIAAVYKEPLFVAYWDISRESLRNYLQSLPKKELTFSLLCKEVYLQFPSVFPKKSIKIIGDKNPPYSLFMEELITVFPEAKFIHLLRDYRNQIVSARKHFTLQNVALLAYKWEIHNRAIDKQKQKNPSAFYTLKYEDFTADPEKYTREMCSFLGISYQAEMLQFHKKTTTYFETEKFGFDVIHPHLLEPIANKNTSAWQKEFTEKEKETIDYIAGDYAAKYGYPKTHPKKNIRLFCTLLYCQCQHQIDIRVTKMYYKLPFFIRDFFHLPSKKMYEWFGYINYYSKQIDKMKKAQKNKF